MRMKNLKQLILKKNWKVILFKVKYIFKVFKKEAPLNKFKINENVCNKKTSGLSMMEWCLM